MLIAQISDTHVPPPGRKTCGVAPMADNLRRCVESLNALRPKPDLVLVTGDITNTGREDEARHAWEILSALEMPFFVIPGNHDDRRVIAETFGAGACPTDGKGHVNYVVEGFPLRLIGLDTVDPGKPGGRLDEDALDWLEARLSEDRSKPTLLFAHHPPLRLGVPETDEDGFIGADRLATILAAQPQVERFLCGHIHLHTNTRWGGTLVTTAPSPGMQLTLDLTQETESRFLLSDPAYLLHHWTPDRNLITHPIMLSTLDGPYRFEDEQPPSDAAE